MGHQLCRAGERAVCHVALGYWFGAAIGVHLDPILELFDGTTTAGDQTPTWKSTWDTN